MGPLRAQLSEADGSDGVGCVEVAFHQGKAGVRDSTGHGTGPVPGFTAHPWRCFIEGASNGESSLPG